MRINASLRSRAALFVAAAAILTAAHGLLWSAESCQKVEDSCANIPCSAFKLGVGAFTGNCGPSTMKKCVKGTKGGCADACTECYENGTGVHSGGTQDCGFNAKPGS